MVSFARIAQAVEHFIGNEEVPGSTPGVSTTYWSRPKAVTGGAAIRRCLAVKRLRVRSISAAAVCCGM